jgi:hypothetical protein
MRINAPLTRETIIETVREHWGVKREAARHLGISAQRLEQLLEPKKHAARQAAQLAVAEGRLVRLGTCATCGTECFPHAHHEDYSKPLDVEWLCVKCHSARHAAANEIANGGIDLERRSHQLRLKLTAAEHCEINAATERASQPAEWFVRDAALRQARLVNAAAEDAEDGVLINLTHVEYTHVTIEARKARMSVVEYMRQRVLA